MAKDNWRRQFRATCENDMGSKSSSPSFFSFLFYFFFFFFFFLFFFFNFFLFFLIFFLFFFFLSFSFAFSFSFSFLSWWCDMCRVLCGILERCAHQYRYEPPPEFFLTLPFSGIDHHLSGRNAYALGYSNHSQEHGRSQAHTSKHSHSLRFRLNTQKLADM